VADGARLAILKGAASVTAGLAALLMAAAACAQTPDPAIADSFARRGWHLELTAHAASETWNYNVSHETLIGVAPGITYGLRDGLVLTAAGPLYYVDQRGADAYLLGATFGVRRRVYRARRGSAFLEFDVGASKADSMTPPRGTQFNYLAAGAAGATVRLRSGLHLLATLRWIHVSNNGLAGPSRNPDIEAIGPQVGVLIGF
jgi:opacity protein-like surface antigen